MRHRSRAVVLAPAMSARGGAERVALAFAAALRDAGHDVTLVAPGNVDDVAQVGTYLGVDIAGVRTVHLPQVGCLGRLEALRTVIEERAWVRAVRRLRPDLFVNCVFDATPVVPDARNVYYVHFPHEPRPQVLAGVRGVYVRAAEWARRRMNGGRDFRAAYDDFFANSRFTASHVQEYWGVHADVLYPPCRPIVNTGDEEAARRRWIVSVGRFQASAPGRPHKNHLALIDAFRELSDLHREGWQLHLVGSVGSTEEVARLRDAAADLPVIFHLDAPLDELHQIYRTSSIYWHAQGYGEPVEANPVALEHFGITTVEALSAGLLPVVHASGGPQEIVAGLAGAATWQSLEELRATTRALIDATPEERRKWRREALQRSTEFSDQHFAAHVVRRFGEDR